MGAGPARPPAGGRCGGTPSPRPWCARTAGRLWTSVRVVASTGSTNADLLARGGPEGQVLVAEEQTAGRGRSGRTWVSQPGASLTFSVLLRPASVPPSARGWLPLLTGVAVAAGVRSAAGVAARLKWPNDILVGDRKLAGILAEQSADGDAVVIGVGLNVATSEAGAAGIADRPARHLAAGRGGRRRPRGAAGGDPALARALVPAVQRESRSGQFRPAGAVPRGLRDPRPPGPGRAPGRPGARRHGRGHRPDRPSPGPPGRRGVSDRGLGRRRRPPALVIRSRRMRPRHRWVARPGRGRRRQRR